MMLLAICLTLAYVAVAALLLNLSLATPAHRALKVLAIVLVTGLYGAAWWGHSQLMGWATADPMPRNFRLAWVTIDEPDKAGGTDGTIYFWVRELDEAGLIAGPPRAYQIPWDEQHAEEAEEALKALEEGEILNGSMSRSLLKDDDPDVAEISEYAGDPNISGAGGGEPMFEFFRAPPPALPPKGT